MMYETIIIILLIVICFLLYNLYRLKYKVTTETSKLIPSDIKKEFEKVDEESSKEIFMRFNDINSKLSELEIRIEKAENFIKKLIEELGE
ncbi:MAG: hypothetical protein QW051_02670 [Candidatus Aenigmatarchaeota archaeon]